MYTIRGNIKDVKLRWGTQVKSVVVKGWWQTWAELGWSPVPQGDHFVSVHPDRNSEGPSESEVSNLDHLCKIWVRANLFMFDENSSKTIFIVWWHRWANITHPILVNQQVGWLQISVHDTPLVTEEQTLREKLNIFVEDAFFPGVQFNIWSWDCELDIGSPGRAGTCSFWSKWRPSGLVWWWNRITLCFMILHHNLSLSYIFLAWWLKSKSPTYDRHSKVNLTLRQRHPCTSWGPS